MTSVSNQHTYNSYGYITKHSYTALRSAISDDIYVTAPTFFSLAAPPHSRGIMAIASHRWDNIKTPCRQPVI